MTLRDLMKRHARTELVRADHHGELVTYHFKAGGERTFLAVVDRLQLEPVNERRQSAVAQTATVFLPNHDVAGVESIADGDEITCVVAFGAAAVRCRIDEVLTADEGGFLVRVVE